MEGSGVAEKGDGPGVPGHVGAEGNHAAGRGTVLLFPNGNVCL